MHHHNLTQLSVVKLHEVKVSDLIRSVFSQDTHGQLVMDSQISNYWDWVFGLRLVKKEYKLFSKKLLLMIDEVWRLCLMSNSIKPEWITLGRKTRH